MKTFATFVLMVMLLAAVPAAGQNATAPAPPEGTAGSGFVTFPEELSYQGLLTTSTGTPAADGIYTLQFDLFSVPVAGGTLWTETQAGVAVNDGVFSVRLGSITPFTDLFLQALWLQVSATAGPGISGTVTFTPRTQLAAAAFSLAPWHSSGYDIYYPGFGSVMIGSSVPNPSAKLAVEGRGRWAGLFTSDSLSSAVRVVDGTSTAVGNADMAGVYGSAIPNDFFGIGGEFTGGWHGVEGYTSASGSASYTGVWGAATGGAGTNRGIWGQAFGEGANYAVMGSTNDSAGHYAGYFSGRLRVLSGSGDSAAMLPADAVSAAEMLDETGLASHSPYSSASITGTPSSVDSVSVTAPTDGYIVVEAGGVFEITHTTGTLTNIWASLSTVADVLPNAFGFQWGYVAAANPTAGYRQNFHCRRTYAVTAGAYEYFLNASLQSGAGPAYATYKWISATFYPTSYGPVTVAAPEADPASSAAPERGVEQPVLSSAAEVDLRDMELQALRLRSQAEEAEKKLLEAQLDLERSKRNDSDRPR